MQNDSNTLSTRKPLLVLAAVAVAAFAAAQQGCNTTEGVGKDLESAGEGISDAARDAKQ